MPNHAARPAPGGALVRGDWSAESRYRAGLRITEEPDCTAVFVANDQMALGLLRALNERGRRVPEDVSVVGFDDIPESASFLPPLTTVHQDFAGVGRLCVEEVLSKMREGAGAWGALEKAGTGRRLSPRGSCGGGVRHRRRVTAERSRRKAGHFFFGAV